MTEEWDKQDKEVHYRQTTVGEKIAATLCGYTYNRLTGPRPRSTRIIGWVTCILCQQKYHNRQN